jgi:hypothetical protein
MIKFTPEFLFIIYEYDKKFTNECIKTMEIFSSLSLHPETPIMLSIHAAGKKTQLAGPKVHLRSLPLILHNLVVCDD